MSCPRRSIVRRRRSAAWLAVVAAAVLAAADGPPPRPGPFPDPPAQGTPWSPPETRLPRFLVRATEDLFACGLADPRGLEYRAITLENGPSPATRGWLLPPREGDTRRFAVGWDATVHRVAAVGAPADLEADARAMVAAAQKAADGPDPFDRSRPSRPGPWVWGAAYGAGATAVRPAPIRLVLLLRLGRADLAEALFAAATGWSPPDPGAGPDLTDFGISSLTLADSWARPLYNRGVSAHARGDDATALDAFRRLAAFRRAFEPRARERGFRPSTQNRVGVPPSFLPGLDQLDALLADQERRAAEPPRDPVPPRGADPSARVAALIRDLDQIAVQQVSVPGSAHPGASPLVDDLVAMGDPAVEPLLDALEADERLTRSVSHGGMMDGTGHVHPVSEAISAALRRLMKSPVPGVTLEMERPDPASRRRLAQVTRAFWEANRAVPVAERYYRDLANDAASPGLWVAAARALAAPEGEFDQRRGVLWRRTPARPPLGEPLRDGREPSVTALLIRRAETLSAGELEDAAGIARSLAAWEPTAAGPVLKRVMDGILRRLESYRSGTVDDSSRRALPRTLAEFTLMRARGGDLAALEDYAAWIATARPEDVPEYGIEVFEPLWRYPDRPSITIASRKLFAEPASPWLPLLSPRPGTGDRIEPQALIASRMLAVPAFREAVRATLADATPYGAVKRDGRQPGLIAYTLATGRSGTSGMVPAVDLEGLPASGSQPIRVRDWAASLLGSLEGTPRFALTWPEPRRDAAIAALDAFLVRYGPCFDPNAPTPPFSPFGEGPALLAFPDLGRPATRADVEAGRAIFSLEGEGDEVRVVPLPARPMEAAWATLEDAPQVVQYGDGRIEEQFDRSGRVWQAEEVRRGDSWHRSFGFVGRNTIARAPAEEIEFVERFTSGTQLGGGLDARLAPADPGSDEGPPIVVLSLRNRSGLDVPAPAEWVRADADGRPLLRRGVTLEVWHAPEPPRAAGGERAYPAEADFRPIEAIRPGHFEPGGATRTLGPGASFKAIRIDLRAWIPEIPRGYYRIRIRLEGGAGPEGGARDAADAVLHVGPVD